MKHNLLLLYSWIVYLLFMLLPNAPFIMRIRGFFYLLFNSNKSKNFQVSRNVILINLENLIIGNNVYLAPGVIINAIGTIHLDDEVMIGFNSVLNSGNHTIKNDSYRYGVKQIKPIYVGSGAWIAANCTIAAGSRIGRCSIIAANSFFSSKSEDFSIYGGVPAVLIKTLKKC
jgi:maltose O-acetyltransferase